MQSDPDLLTLARSVLGRNRAKTWDTAWDSRGTAAKTVSQDDLPGGTPKTPEIKGQVAGVPLSQALGDGTVGQCEIPGTLLGTVAGQPYSEVLSALRSKCPDLVERNRWLETLRDAESFLPAWGLQANALGWTARDLFGLHTPPARPTPSYDRLSRYDATGLIWHLRGRPVVAITGADAAIQGASTVTIYRKSNKPALGPLGDSLNDMGAA